MRLTQKDERSWLAHLHPKRTVQEFPHRVPTRSHGLLIYGLPDALTEGCHCRPIQSQLRKRPRNKNSTPYHRPASRCFFEQKFSQQVNSTYLSKESVERFLHFLRIM